MYNLKDANKEEIDINDIIRSVSEYDIWKKYCSNFDEIDKPFLSELYNDRNPSCRIKANSNNRLMYKDFGTGDSYGYTDYICVKYGCTFKECLRIIYNDFKLGSIKYDILPQLVLNDILDVKLKPKKAFIEIVDQPFTLVDYDYWNKFEIPLELLQEYDVFSCKIVYLHTKQGKTITFEYKDNNPIYAYRFCNNGKYSYKIYFPLNKDKKHKWLFSGGSQEDIEGIDQLPLFANDLILTKSLKDCIVYKLLGLPAISLQGETNKLSQHLVDLLHRRFNNIIVNYDNDDEGIKGSKRLKQQYRFNYFFIDGEKDISDFVQLYGLEQAKIMINEKINKINE